MNAEARLAVARRGGGDGLMRAVTTAQAAAGAVAVSRLARGRSRRAPLAADAERPARPVTVVIPARDEAERLGPCLEGLRADPDVSDVIVVDDCSTDATADLARAGGARVVDGSEPPAGWVGKPWALQQGLEAATGEVVVSVDADTRPRPGLVAALVAALEAVDFVTVGCRFDCEQPVERWLHASMLATLVYRFGPADTDTPVRPSRVVANGQCTAVGRQALLDIGGYRLAAGNMTDDAALARGLARRGWRVAFRDGAGLIDVDMHDSASDVWREWGRSIAMPDVTPMPWRLADLAVIWLTLPLPLIRLVARRAGRVDLFLLAMRWALLAVMAPAYRRRGVPFWLSPLADPAVAVRFTWSALRPARRWRGRTYVP